MADVVATRALGTEGLVTSSGTTDGGLWDVVTRMKSNWGVLKGRLDGAGRRAVVLDDERA